MDCIVHGVTKSQTQLRDLHFLHKRPPVVVEQVSVSVWGTLEGDEGPLLFHVIVIADSICIQFQPACFFYFILTELKEDFDCCFNVSLKTVSVSEMCLRRESI